jgi:hypothetical protein
MLSWGSNIGIARGESEKVDKRIDTVGPVVREKSGILVIKRTLYIKMVERAGADGLNPFGLSAPEAFRRMTLFPVGNASGARQEKGYAAGRIRTNFVLEN